MKKMAVLMILSLLSMVTLPLQAALVTTQSQLQQEALQFDRQELKNLMAQDDVRKKMLSLGVAPEMVDARIDNLTPVEISQLNQQLSTAPAGGDVLGAIVLIFIVFIITDAIGATDIFSFVHPVR